MNAPVDYLDPQLPSGLSHVSMPVVDATEQSLVGYGCLVDDPGDCAIEIVRWPARGTRPVDADTGDQGGTTEGVFVSEWRGDILYGRNEAVDGHYVKWHTISDLEASVVEDVARLRGHPLVPKTIPIHGYIYDVRSGRLIEVSGE